MVFNTLSARLGRATLATELSRALNINRHDIDADIRQNGVDKNFKNTYPLCKRSPAESLPMPPPFLFKVPQYKITIITIAIIRRLAIKWLTTHETKHATIPPQPYRLGITVMHVVTKTKTLQIKGNIM